MDLLAINSNRLCAIRRRSQGRCVVLPDQAMPPGTTPSRGRIGVEQSGGKAWLLVDRCTPPAGAPPDVERWLRSGSAQFDDFDELTRWIRDALAPAYRQRGGSLSPPADQPPNDGAGDSRRPCFLEAEAIAEELERQVLGQRPALTVISEAAARHVARVSPRRPLTLLCVGPTGVGKTSAAACLAEVLSTQTGHEWGFVRLDGSEMQESHTVARLFGAPPGYVGYGDGTPLADTLRANPYSVVLVDEIEKAASSVFRAFISLLDTGRMTDSAGEINAQHAIFLFTSNLAAEGILRDIEANGSLHDADLVDSVTRRHIRQHGVLPELVSRITHLAVFSRLDVATQAAIAELAVRRVAASYGIEAAAIDPQVLEALAPGRVDPAWGVRTLEYRTDAALGATLMDAAKSGATGPIRLLGGTDSAFSWRPLDATDNRDNTEAANSVEP